MRIETNSEVFDHRSALASVGWDRDFLSEVAGLFQAAWPTLSGEIREALASGDLREVEKSVRLVKAAANNVSAKKVSEAAQCLETAAREGSLKAARAACSTLEHEVERLAPYLAPFRNCRGVQDLLAFP